MFQSMLPESSISTSTLAGTPTDCSNGRFVRLKIVDTWPGGGSGGGSGAAFTTIRMRYSAPVLAVMLSNKR